MAGAARARRDALVSAVLSTLLSAPLVVLVYWFLRRTQRRWWLWTWAALVPLTLFMSFVQPLWIDPLYDSYTPLATRAPELVARLQTLARRRGEEIPAERVLEMNASAKLRTVNAFVRGYGRSERIIVWDTTLQGMNEPEISFLFAHELGHYVEHHIFIAEALELVGLFGELWLASVIVMAILRRRGERLGFARLDQLQSLPLLVLVFALVSMLSTPLENGMWRRLEHRADAFGLRTIRGVVDDPPQAAAHALQRLGELALSRVDPEPFNVVWFYNHPPTRDRIRFVLDAPP